MEQVIEWLRLTSAELAAELETFDGERWEWRPGDGTWSARENTEHLILVERGVLTLIRRAMSQPAVERVAGMTDEEVWSRLSVANNRLAAPERVQPSGKWSGRAEAMAEWQRLRGETILYAQTTADPLRERFVQLTAGQLDGAQGLIMLAAHARRHTSQIRELRNRPGFPTS